MIQPTLDGMVFDNRDDFIAALDSFLVDVSGMGYGELPDVVFIDDWYDDGVDGLTVRDCAWEILDEAGYPRDLLNERIYGTDRFGEPIE